MTEDASNTPKTRQTNVTFACVLLSLALLLVFPIIGAYAFNAHGTNGLIAAALAGAICWSGAMIALLLVLLFRNSPNQMISATLLGMLFRMGLPLVTGVVLTRAGGPLADAGLFGMIMVFYLVGLVLETTLSVRVLGSSQTVAKAS
ncbi:MAG TPA: hypothetical protein QF564_14780 [Pirellulaceae bacterium]|nr:hypothetical protein [Pirellulaceae bacterium]